MHTQRAVSHRQKDRTKLSFASSYTWTNKYKSQFKHANRKRCERAHSAPTRSVLCAQGPCRETPQSTWTPNLTLLALVLTNTYKIMSKTHLGVTVGLLVHHQRSPKHTHHMDFILNSISHHAHWLHTHLFSITWTLFKPFWPSILGLLLLYLTAITKKITHCSWLNYILVLTIINPQSNQKIFRHQIQFFDIRLLVGAGQYTL